MNKHELRLALRAAAQVARERQFFLIGSQAVHASCKRPPAEVLLSQECDLYPRTHPEAAGLIDRKLGRNSDFARKHGFYVDSVAPELANLPDGWERRLKSLRVGRITAFCLELHDLLASKMAAGRLKDLELAGAMLKLGLARASTLRKRLTKLEPASVRTRTRSSLEAVLTELRRGARSPRLR